MTDHELLQAYLNKQDDAFAQLVQRHLPLVYHTARRLVGEANAEDIAQAVFTLLASKAAELSTRTTLAGWLHEATRYCCNNFYKSDQRRRKYEAEAAMQKDPSSPAPNTQIDLRDALDAALARLNTREREAVLLRYMESRSIEETATALAIAPKAAAKRATRGLEKLRVILSAKGVAVPAGGLAALLIAETSQAVPVTVAAATTAAHSASSAAAALAQSLGAGLRAGKASTTGLALAAKIAACVAVLAGITLGAIFVAQLRATGPKQSAPVEVGKPASGAIPDPPPLLAVEAGSPTTLANYILLTDESVANQLRTRGTLEVTQSSGYSAYRMPAESYHVLMRQLRGKKIIHPLTPRIATLWKGYDYLITTLSQVAIEPEDSIRAGLPFLGAGGNWRRPGTVTRSDGNPNQLMLNQKIEFDRARISIDQSRNNDVPLEGLVEINAAINRGEVIACVGKALHIGGQNLTPIVIYEAFGASEEQQRLLPAVDHVQSFEWIYYGADHARWAAERALLWESMAPRKFQSGQPGTPRWEQKLDDGTTVRVIAIGRPEAGAMCWWDGDGNPVAGLRPDYTFNMFVSTKKSEFMYVLVEASYSHDSWPPRNIKVGDRELDISRFCASGTVHADNRERLVHGYVFVDPKHPTINASVDCGQAQRIGEIVRYKDEQVVGGREIRGFMSPRAQDPRGEDAPFQLSLSEVDGNEDEILFVTLVLHDNTTVPIITVPQLYLDAQQVMSGDRDHGNLSQVSNLKWSEVKRVELWSRPIKTVTFGPLPVMPNVPIPVNVAPDAMFNRTQSAADRSTTQSATQPVNNTFQFHVFGAVKRPGIYTFTLRRDETITVKKALAAAGGVKMDDEEGYFEIVFVCRVGQKTDESLVITKDQFERGKVGDRAIKNGDSLIVRLPAATQPVE